MNRKKVALLSDKISLFMNRLILRCTKSINKYLNSKKKMTTVNISQKSFHTIYSPPVTLNLMNTEIKTNYILASTERLKIHVVKKAIIITLVQSTIMQQVIWQFS